MTLEEQYAFRAEMVAALARDLCGPGAQDELLDDAPLEQYVTGILYPRRENEVEPIEPDRRDETDDDGPDSNPDPPVALANRRYPSSMGVTFAVDSGATSLQVSVSAGRYDEVPGEPGTAARQRRRFGGTGRGTRWQRTAAYHGPIEISCGYPRDDKVPFDDGLELFSRVRAPDEHGRISITIVLVNRNVVKSGLRDSAAFFQTTMTITGAGEQAPFVPRPVEGVSSVDADVRAYRLLYRHAPAFAVGHGCSAEWELDDSGRRATVIRTTYIPRHDLRLSDSNRDIDTQAFSMRRIATAPKDDVLASLQALGRGYAAWIDREHAAADTATDLDEEQRITAHEHLNEAAAALGRIREGIELLGRDEKSWEAFKLMNRAMLMQRARSEWLVQDSPPDGPNEDDRHRWRPFQIAFILLALRGIAEPATADRRLVDLLWFPTGGGKTEAYLGLIAFTVFRRRLSSPSSGAGVTALMRYTLRLLTTQQFQRAGLLIASCEAIRRMAVEDGDSRLGNDEISIGLWVGADATPQDRKEADEALSKIQRGAFLDVGNPMQVRQCPWCGAELGIRNYWIAKAPPRLVIACRTADCLFRDGLPIFVVDEDVYAYRPSLLIATVDKFASLPWRPDVSKLFNLDSALPPPELIIQDELHLISGPLGTLTGLYETVIDELASSNGIPPKVVASTATIRRAADQARGLFGRDVRQFPPPGTDARDSYFSVELTPTEKGTRLYVGVSAPGVSQTTLLIRTYAALLQGGQDLPGSEATRDPYWTLVGYFNSLRVLGAAEIQIRDDVVDRMELLAARAGTSTRPVDQRIELTSREASTSIPEHLKAVTVPYPDPQAIDIILATNMISVGVDIDRLGLMAVMGQPQATSEYIQATSRVGRRYPGLVVTMLNAAKSRDRSHFESFVAYHSALYRQVEATSVTPFSPRARDRALHAVLVALARHRIPGLRENTSAVNVADFRNELEQLADLVVVRAEAAEPGTGDATREHLRALIDRWSARASGPGGLAYARPRDPSSALLVGAGETVGTEALPTMWSLRDVDAETHLYLE